MKKLILFIVLISFPFFYFLWPSKANNELEVKDQTEIVKKDLTATTTEAPVIITNPVKIKIPSIQVNAVVENVGQDAQGRMDVPKKDEDVAWWGLGVKPGEIGNAVFAGHYDRKDGGPAVFYDLRLVDIGDEITIVDEKGQSLTFEVYKKEMFKDAQFPLDLVFGGTEEKNLNLITCDGVFDKTNKNYSDRLVVFSKIKE